MSDTNMNTIEILQGIKDWTSRNLSKKSNIDGFYETMGVGTAMNLVGKTENTNNSMYRKTGGAEEATDGTATLKNIKGNTVAWNQMVFQSVSIGNSIHKWRTFDNYTTLTANERELQILKSDGFGIAIYGLANGAIVSNHVYYLCAKIKTTAPANMIIVTAYGVDDIIDKGRTQTATTDWQSICSIRRCATASSQQYRITDGRNSNFDTVYAKDFIFIDLTLIYGAGNEPTTVAQFEADYERWFGKPLTYEPYDAGSLRSVQLDAIKTVGFNQYNNGSAKVIGGVQYQITGTYTSISLGEETITPDANGLFTPSTTGTLTIVGGGSDTCVHISGNRNGTYEPYEEHIASVPTTTLTGKLNGEGSSVVVFPDGMKKAGTVYDEIVRVGNVTKAIKRVGSVDLGTLSWILHPSGNFYVDNAIDRKFSSHGLCACYKEAGKSIHNGVGSLTEDKSFAFQDNNNDVRRRIVIKDTSYSDASTFTTAMSGVYLYYELETSEEYILDDFDLPKPYVVNGDGTEEQVQKQGVQGVASMLTCSYGMDAVKTLMNLPQRFVSAAEEQNFSESQKVLARRNIGVEEILAHKANQEGVYEGLTVGLADNLRGDNVVGAEFYRRKSGGTQSVTSGIAAIKEVRGKSIVWNQLANSDFFHTTHTGFSYDDTNHLMTYVSDGTNINSWPSFKSIHGHKYYCMYLYKASQVSSATFAIWGYIHDTVSVTFDSTEWKKHHNIGSQATDYTYIPWAFKETENGVTYYVTYPIIIDLTLMFGAGNEPATVEEFEKMFPLGYYDYNAGEVIPFAGENLVTTGFNQWDEEWVLGTLNQETGEIVSGSFLCSKNLISVIPNTTYYLYIPKYGIRFCYFDGNKKCLGTFTCNNGVFTTPKECRYLRFHSNRNGEPYNHDICINISDPNKNGTYEPYKEPHTLPLDPSQWRDKQGNLVFPYGGMHGVGTAYDYAKVDADGYIRKAVRVFGSVDMGDCSYTYESTNNYFLLTNLLNRKFSNEINLISPIYNCVGDKSSLGMADVGNMTISGNNNNINIKVKNTAYSDAASLRSAMSGVYLYYELDEPVEVELATPVYANYYVNGGGTEAIEPDNGAAPYTTPANLSILYAMDARGEINNLPKNYLNKESAENMLGAMQTAGIIAGYTMTFDAATNRYVFTITAPAASNE